MWQNSTIRGMLNGINVMNITKNGNPSFAAPKGGYFVGKGFVDDMCRDFIIERYYVHPEETEKVQKEVDDVFFKAIKDAGFEHLL